MLYLGMTFSGVIGININSFSASYALIINDRIHRRP